MRLIQWLIDKISQYLAKETRKKPSYLCDFGRICHEIRLADVLLIEGGTRVSKVIRRLTHSPWTHSALYIGRLHDIDDPQMREFVHQHHQGKPNEQLLVESLIGKGTVITPIMKYQKQHIRICRPSGLSYADAQAVVTHAIKTLGRQYNLAHVLNLASFLLVSRWFPMYWKSRPPKQNSRSTTQDICSSMIANAFTAVHFPILPLIRKNKEKTLEIIQRNPQLFTPRDFDYSPYFDIIKYPIFQLHQPTTYRNLPWNKTLMSNDIDLSKSSEDPSISS